MIELNKLAQEIHAAAVEKGFWNVEDAMEKHIAKMHSELSEALNEDRMDRPMLYVDDIAVSEPVTDIHRFDGRKPEGIAAELADFVMMALDYTARASMDVDGIIGPKRNIMRSEMYYDYESMPLYKLVLFCHYALDKTSSPDCRSDIQAGVQIMIHGVELWLEQRGVDLWQVIRLKMEYNKSRPPLHGRKY